MCTTPPRTVAGDSTTTPCPAPPHSTLPHLFKIINKCVRERTKTCGRKHKSCIWKPAYWCPCEVCTYWQRSGLLHYSSAAQTSWVTLQGGTEKQSTVRMKIRWANTVQDVDAGRVRASKRLTLDAALHMSATILPDTRVSKMLVVAKLKTFSRATCWNKLTNVFIYIYRRENEARGVRHMCEVLTLKMSKEHCVRMVLKVEDKPSSTRLSKWVIFSVSVSSRVCSRVLLSISAKHLGR